jgi:A/G-specific adenine glycosylase
MDFSAVIIKWYNKNKRDLPWRKTTNPYHIWLSEIILQQTRVDQGMNYYFAFTEKYPDLKALANASIDDVMKTWQGLGYYSRARNLHATAKYICENLSAEFPKTYNELIALKGVGPYTAAAIASFANNECVAVVDGNVYRVLSRYFGIDTPIDSTSGKKEFLSLSNSLIHKKKPAIFNQAIMEFGALQCKPKNPDCTNCPFQFSCFAFENKKVDELPIKSKKTKIKTRYFTYFFIVDKNNHSLIRKRTENDIWKELYEFPLLESVMKISTEEISLFLKEKLQLKDFVIEHVSTEIKHVLSHQHLFTNFIQVSTDDNLNQNKLFLKIKLNELNAYAFPRLIEKFLNSELATIHKN